MWGTSAVHLAVRMKDDSGLHVQLSRLPLDDILIPGKKGKMYKLQLMHDEMYMAFGCSDMCNIILSTDRYHFWGLFDKGKWRDS